MPKIPQGQPSPQSRALQGLPKQFVDAMRTLFDVLDDTKSGQVAMADIEMWWRKDSEEGGQMPRGVIESLKKVTPPSGKLTFERFCAGLKICLLRNQGQKSKTDHSESNDGQSANSEGEDQSQRVAQLRKQRYSATPSPALSLPPRLSPPDTPNLGLQNPHETPPEPRRRTGGKEMGARPGARKVCQMGSGGEEIHLDKEGNKPNEENLTPEDTPCRMA